MDPSMSMTTAILAAQAFHPGTSANHLHQAQSSIELCDYYHLQFLNSPPSTLCYYVTYLTTTFTSTNSVCNYVSGVRFPHKQLCLAPESLDFSVMCLLRADDLTMCTHTTLSAHPCVTQRCQLSSSMGSIRPPMKVCLTFGFMGMLRQSNLGSLSDSHMLHM